jgi:hypothetical protein
MALTTKQSSHRRCLRPSSRSRRLLAHLQTSICNRPPDLLVNSTASTPWSTPMVEPSFSSLSSLRCATRGTSGRACFALNPSSASSISSSAHSSTATMVNTPFPISETPSSLSACSKSTISLVSSQPSSHAVSQTISPLPSPLTNQSHSAVL